VSAVVSIRAVDAELTTPAPLSGGLPALFREPTTDEQDLGVAQAAFRRTWPRRENPKATQQNARQQLRSNIEYQRYLRNRLAGDAGNFVRRFTDALDEVLAPVVATLDNLPAYFDPRTAPEHLLDWLAGWVGLELFEKWPPELRRPLVADAVQRHRQRGTKLGVQNVVALFAEVDPEQVTIEESGGVWGLATVALDDGRFPELPEARTKASMKITVALGKKRAEEVASVEQLVRRVAERLKPAHVWLEDVVVEA
jgi:phage tail-like protein